MSDETESFADWVLSGRSIDIAEIFAKLGDRPTSQQLADALRADIYDRLLSELPSCYTEGQFSFAPYVTDALNKIDFAGTAAIIMAEAERWRIDGP